jgi:intein-encoded DNA endonuclease-like protein
MGITETQQQNRETIQTTQNPHYTPTGGTSRQEHVSRREEKHPPVWGCAPGLRPPGKAMTEKVVASDPGPRGEGRMPQGQEQKTQEGRRSYLPRELRIRLFDEVDKLRREGLTYSEIIEEMRRRYGVRLFKSHISYWTHGLHSPYNGRRYLPLTDSLRPCEELAYIIGAKLGDGYAYKRGHAIRSYNDVIIGLKVKDREFAVEFGRCLAKVLGRQPIRPRYNKSSERYTVEAKSQTVYELLKKPVDLDRLKPYIEHCERCVAAFIRGFADSEGSVSEEGYIRIHNTDYRLLEYVKDLLKRFGIESTGPKPNRLQGKTFFDHKKMKRYTYKKECFHIYIRAGSNVNFYKNIGFTIERKQKRLENYVRRRQQNPLPLHFPFFIPHSPTSHIQL